ncbi:MAG: hypothetical protein KJ064_23730 [Anaerolineae bacterium]|nr:hypothetical protein [Anaerolineae bacterium]
MRSIGIIIFVILVAMPTLAVVGQETPPAFFVTLCPDGRQIVGHHLIFENLAPTDTLRFTVVGKDGFDPAMAFVDDPNNPECAINTPEVATTTVAVPSIGRVDANSFAAQRSISAGGDRKIEVIVGGFAGLSGQYALVVENLGIDSAGETDTMRLQIPFSASREWIGVFMIGATAAIDPVLAVYAGEPQGRPLSQCDNAGTQTCPNTPNMKDRGALFPDGSVYAGDDFDAGIMSVYKDAELTYTFRDATSTATGDYIVVVTGIAPGAVATETFICDPVEIELRDSSPAYNPAYKLENIIDGDPLTFWVTGAPPINPSTGSRDQNAFVVVGLLEDRPISQIRINGYAQAVDGTEINSLKRFAVRFPDANQAEIVTAIDSELSLQAGYQKFTFLPTVVDEFGLILLDNYGGTLFVLVDIQVCAAVS